MDKSILDRLLGRSELKQEINEKESVIENLEEQVSELEKRLEKEEKRRKEAVTEKQKAQEELNKAEHKLESIDASGSGSEEHDKSYQNRSLSRHEASSLLNLLGSIEAGREDLCTAIVVEKSSFSDPLMEVLGEGVSRVNRKTPCVVFADDFSSIGIVMEPPVINGEHGEIWDSSFKLDVVDVEPTQHVFCFIRSNYFSISFYDGDSLIQTMTEQIDLMENHSKGGFSQSRFERRREEQIQELVRLAENRIEEFVDEYNNCPIYISGEKSAYDELDFSADRFRSVDTSSNVQNPSSDAFEKFWQTRITRV